MKHEAMSNAELLARLITFDTVSRNSNMALADFLCDYLDDTTVRIEKHLSPDGSKTNLIVSLGPDDPGPERRGLVLSGHMDVVPAEEPDWNSDPFSMKSDGNSFVGRGSADMKGFLAIATNAIRNIDGAKLKHPLSLIFTYDEEVGTVGAMHFAKEWPHPEALPKAAVIGEPTSLNVIRMHKGHMSMRITLSGVGAHSGYPHLGKNAIEPAGKILLALSELRQELQQEEPEYREFFPEVPFVPLNVGTIQGGVAINVVPNACVIQLGFRLLPGMQREPMVRRIEDAIRNSVPGEELAVEVVAESPPLLLDDSVPVYRSACSLVNQEDTHSASYATDGGWLQQMGMDCIIWGPGSIEVAHKPNESIPVEDVARGAELINQMIEKHCRV
ncbi:MAG: acetylornithine deacetylase [Gemmatimonadota bacterium]|nr:acetylornithine deacetylase [Gemmatimonadota bacterium]